MIAPALRPIAKKRPAHRWTSAELAAELPESNLPTELWDGELSVDRWRPGEQTVSRLLKGFAVPVADLFGGS